MANEAKNYKESMTTILKIFIAHLGERTMCIPHQLIHTTLDTMDSSIAMRKLRNEEWTAFNKNNKQIREKMIDDAIHKTGECINNLFEKPQILEQELCEQKKQNKLNAQLTKHKYCQRLKQAAIAII